MQYRGSIFGGLLKLIDRRQFAAIVERYDGDAYDKSFDSWSHLVSLIGAQLSGAGSLRELEAAWQANGHHHYHLGVGKLRRSTLSDANRRRRPAIFTELFDMLVKQTQGPLRREAKELIRLIDASPIMIQRIAQWARWNGRIHGLKLHVVYDPEADMPQQLSITPATVNDVSFRSEVPIEPGTTYVFDKAYCHYAWWTAIDRAGAWFVTRRKTNAQFRIVHRRPIADGKGDGFTILSDSDIERSSKGNLKLDITLRLIRLKRDNGKTLDLLTNDTKRSAVEIAELYKRRWQIELLFRWIKQHLNIRRFLGTSENAVRLQILAAMIAFVLLRIAARLHRVAAPAIRFAQLVGQCLFVRKQIARIDKPPEINPSKSVCRSDPNQLQFCYV
jgi:putative transposase